MGFDFIDTTKERDVNSGNVSVDLFKSVAEVRFTF